MKMTIEERFWAKVDKRGANDCWLWTGAKYKEGYGQFRISSRDGRGLAHRFAYTISIGEIPAGLHIDHLCRVRACVNPYHLEPVTQQENTLRGESPAAKNAKKTHCPKGHPYSGGNLLVNKNNERRCRKCISETNVKYRAKQKIKIQQGQTTPWE